MSIINSICNPIIRSMEVEVKIRIPNYENYKTLISLLTPFHQKTHNQFNNFFDGGAGELSGQRAVLRLRLYNDPPEVKYVMSLKAKAKLVNGISRVEEDEEEIDAKSGEECVKDANRLVELSGKDWVGLQNPHPTIIKIQTVLSSTSRCFIVTLTYQLDMTIMATSARKPMLLVIYIAMFCVLTTAIKEIVNTTGVGPVFIFGDMTLDVGTNNHLENCSARSDHPYYGIDYPQSKETGRFSNGLNTADTIVQLLVGNDRSS